MATFAILDMGRMCNDIALSIKAGEKARVRPELPLKLVTATAGRRLLALLPHPGQGSRVHHRGPGRRPISGVGGGGL